MVKLPTVLELMKSGAHFGHQVSRWHPKMKRFIYGSRNGVHIIDLEKSIQQLKQAQDFIQQTVSQGGIILFLGTKKQVQQTLKNEAMRCGMPYLTERWVGGFLTNFSIVSKLIEKYNDLVKKQQAGELKKYTKKEQLEFQREIERLESVALGVKDIKKLPDVLFVWDVKKEKTAILEAQSKKIPVIGVCDTNSNPKGIDYIIPLNDDASKTIDLVCKYIADCVLEAKASTSQDAKEQESKTKK